MGHQVSDQLDLAAAEFALDSATGGFAMGGDLVCISGPDAGSYLQGQLSQDVDAMRVGQTAWSFVLDPQGKVVGWGRLVFLAEDDYRFLSDIGFGEVILERLERFKLLVDVQLELSRVSGVAVRGRDCHDFVDGIDVVEGSVWSALADWVSPAETLFGVDLIGGGLDLLELPLAPLELATVLRCRYGIPALGAELDTATIPAAARVVNRSVSFVKGCYVGQELVARVDSRGSNTPSRLVRLSFASGFLPAVGSPLLIQGEEVGVVTTAIDSPRWGGLGLGYLKRKVESPAAVEIASSSGSGLVAEVVEVEDLVLE